MSETEISQQEIQSPEGATFTAEQSFLDAGDPSAALIATVHETQSGSAGNVWQRSSEKVKKILPQRNLERKPNANMLVGEVNRLAQTLEGTNLDLRQDLAIRGLHIAATAQAKK